MREDICTIPISEVFEPKDGCPICRMYEMSEAHLIEYITGAAMMEPDIRMETNRLGFCPRHYVGMMKQRNRLSVSLTLETHLQEIRKTLDFAGKLPDKEQLHALHQQAQGCFVCEKIEWAVARMFNTMFQLWQKEPDFRALYEQQPGLCFKHTELLLRTAQKNMNRKTYAAYAAATAKLAYKQLDPVLADISAYCKMYDYRNAGGDWSKTKDSPERALQFLNGRENLL